MKKTARAGFTLVELSLSLAFIGVLAVAVVLLINNTVSAYQRGLILNHVETLGTDLVDDMRAAVMAATRGAASECEVYYPVSESESSVRKQCTNDEGYKFVTINSVTAGLDAKVELSDGVIEKVPVWGAMCTGAYSYVWNSGYFDAESANVVGASKASLRYQYGGTIAEKTDFRLLKVRDNKRAVCVSTVISDGLDYSVKDFVGRFDISDGYPELTEEPEELILSHEYGDLALYDLAVARPAMGAVRGGALYSVAFVLATVQGGINIMANGQACEVPNSGGLNYCAINQFSFSAQTKGDK